MSDLTEDIEHQARIDCYSAEFHADDPAGPLSYADVVRSSFDFDIPEFAAAEPFAAQCQVFFLPDLTVSWTRTTASRFTRTARTIATQGTDQILVVCYASGWFDMTVEGTTRRVQAGEVAFIDLTREVMIEAPRVDNFSLAISRPCLEDGVAFLDGVHGYVREDDALSRLLRGAMEGIVRNGSELSVVDARGVSEAALRLVVASLAPLARHYVETSRNTVSLVTLKAFIDRHLLESALGPQLLLDAFGITRSTLYRLFEPVGGVSGYIGQRRLAYAFRRLSDTRYPRERISKLAAELGFSHPSAFTRAFKDSFGLAPKQVQALAEHSRGQQIPLVTSDEPMRYFRPLGSA